MSAVPRPTTRPCACLALRKATRRVTQMFDHHLAPSGLRVTQFSILATLAQRGPCALGDLALELVMDRTTLGRNLRPLQRDGLVAIQIDPQDRRSRLLALTAAGMARVRDAADLWSAAQSAFDRAYGRDAADTLHRMLQDVTAARFDVSAG